MSEPIPTPEAPETNESAPAETQFAEAPKSAEEVEQPATIEEKTNE